jgi:hypothetical protein
MIEETMVPSINYLHYSQQANKSIITSVRSHRLMQEVVVAVGSSKGVKKGKKKKNIGHSGLLLVIVVKSTTTTSEVVCWASVEVIRSIDERARKAGWKKKKKRSKNYHTFNTKKEKV